MTALSRCALNAARRLPWVAGLALFSSCARPAGPLFPRIEPPIVFPPPPDTARIGYLGQLRTDQDLHARLSGWQAFGQAVAGQPQPRALSAPTGLVVSDADRLYVTDPPLACLHIFDLAARTYRAVRTVGAAALVAPADVTVTPGYVLLTDAARATVDVLTPTGDYVTTWSNVRLQRPVGIAYSSGADLVYIVDSGAHECVVVSRDGHERTRFGRRGSGAGEFNYPTYAAVTSRSEVLVADSLNFRVQRFEPRGRPLGAIGKKGDAAGDFALPKGVAADADDRIYVADAQFENVQVFDPVGRLLLAIGGEGQQPGRFWLPAKVFIDRRQRLWVADSYNRRVQAFQVLPEPAT